MFPSQAAEPHDRLVHQPGIGWEGYILGLHRGVHHHTLEVLARQRREMRRRAAVEPVIGHVKGEHRMDRNYLKGRDGDRANAVLAAAGYNFSLLLRWFEALLHALIAALLRTRVTPQTA